MPRKKLYPEGHTVYIPHNIDLDILLQEFPISIPNANDYLLYILSSIKLKCTTSNKREIYTFISSRSIRKMVENHSPLFNWLIARGIFTYLPFEQDERPNGYKFNSMYYTELKPVTIRLNTLISKIVTENTTIPIDLSIASVQEHTTERVNEISRYGYYDYELKTVNVTSQNRDYSKDVWIKRSNISKMFNLRPKIMNRSLRELNILPDDRLEPIRYEKGARCFHARTMKNGAERYFLLVNKDLIPVITGAVTHYPNLFPKCEPKTEKKKKRTGDLRARYESHYIYIYYV